MKDKKANIIVGILIMYILFGLFPGVKINYVSPIKFSILKFMDYLIKNFFHLWKVKLLASIAFVFISHAIKKNKLKKYNIKNK